MNLKKTLLVALVAATWPVVAIHAQKPESTDRMALASELSKASVYLGEPVLLVTTWDSTYPFAALKAVDFNFPILNDPRFQVLEPYEPDKEKDAQTTGLPVHGTRVLATRKSRTVGDVQHQSLSFVKILVPKKTGTLSIPPSTLLCAAEKEQNPNPRQRCRNAFQYPAYFDNTFFDQNLAGRDYTRIYTESARLELEVKPLPAEGRPDLFNGMVGDYAIAVAAEPQAVRVGEPVTLAITITAADFPENILFPPLRQQPLLINRFGIPAERALPQRSGNSKSYTQTIRPLSTDLREVPPIQLAYFSLESNTYATIQSAPLPLEVSPAEPIAVFGLGDAAAGMPGKRWLPTLGKIRAAGILPILLLLGLLLLAALFGKKRRRNAKAARAYKVFRKNVARIGRKHRTKNEIYSELDRVLRTYLGDRLNMVPGALSFREVEGKLTANHSGTEAIAAPLKQLFEVCEAYRFTCGFDEKANARKIVRNATRIVKDLERNLKQRGRREPEGYSNSKR